MSALICFRHGFHRFVLNIWTFEFKICFGPPWCDSVGSNAVCRIGIFVRSRAIWSILGLGRGFRDSYFGFIQASFDSLRIGRRFLGPPL